MEQQAALQGRYDEAVRLNKLPGASDPESSIYKKVTQLKIEQENDPVVPHNKYLHRKLGHIREMILNWDGKVG